MQRKSMLASARWCKEKKKIYRLQGPHTHLRLTQKRSRAKSPALRSSMDEQISLRKVNLILRSAGSKSNLSYWIDVYHFFRMQDTRILCFKSHFWSFHLSLSIQSEAHWPSKARKDGRTEEQSEGHIESNPSLDAPRSTVSSQRPGWDGKLENKWHQKQSRVGHWQSQF